MYAMVIDGEYKGQVELAQVLKAIRGASYRIEIAEWQGGKWQSICPDKFLVN